MVIRVMWKHHRSGRDLRHRVRPVGHLTKRDVGLKAFISEGTSSDTTTANRRQVFAIFAGLVRFARNVIFESTKVGLAAARACGRTGGLFQMIPAKLRFAEGTMGEPENRVVERCAEPGITRQTLYRYVGPKGELHNGGQRMLDRRKAQ
jgi:DNA invertase Pin-like site-specific DNA recombinase